MQKPIEYIRLCVDEIIKSSFSEAGPVEYTIDTPKDVSHGEYACNTAFLIAKKISKSPREVADVFIHALEKRDFFEKVSVAGPGFINFSLKREVFIKTVEKILEEKERFGRGDFFENKKIMFEFAHPNTHKAFHIGHLRNICLGESLVRLAEFQGARVFRANYQGDVGLHVAKFLWGYMRSRASEKLETLKQRQEFMGRMYAVGGKAYEEDEKAREEIHEINRRLYKKDKSLMQIWETTRAWSLEYFDHVYARLGSRFDRLFFESEVYLLGTELVHDGMNKGIFEESEGAVIFPGEKYIDSEEIGRAHV